MAAISSFIWNKLGVLIDSDWIEDFMKENLKFGINAENYVTLDKENEIF